jgi:signal peptidase I
VKKCLFISWKENKSFLIFILLMCIFRSAVADWNHVPTGSMKPTILEGDRILVNKMVYDIRLPFTHLSLVSLADPERGDIVIFDSSVSGKRMVKRVVGIPGDVVAMKNNVLFVNGEELSYTDVINSRGDKFEDLVGVRHFIRTDPSGSHLSNFEPVKVPPARYLALGDNRDNSSDSRVIGFIPRDEIVGRAREVVMSLKRDNFYIPRADRFFHSL